MRHWVIVVLVVAVGGCASADGPLTRDALIAAREEAKHRTRRIIMNNDGNDTRQWDPAEPATAETFLSKRVSPLAGTQVDAIFYCSGVFNLYTQRSDVSELLVDRAECPRPWTQVLIDQGTDALASVVAFGHAHDMEVFWSMRMNDTHDSGARWEHLLTQWKKAHPEYLMKHVVESPKYGGRRWSAVNYALPEVRDKAFEILADVCTRYEVDGIELDFFRHPVYFPPQMSGEAVTQAQCDQMTALLRRVRRMTEAAGREWGRPILVAARVPDSAGYAKAIGLDLTRWLEEDLVDILAGGGYFQLEPWANWAALGRRYDVPVYAVLSGSRLVGSKEPETKGDIARWRGQAANAWAAGVDGIYTFNRFNPHDPIFRELGDPKKLETLESTYEFIPGDQIDRWLKNGKRFLKMPEQAGRRLETVTACAATATSR